MTRRCERLRELLDCLVHGYRLARAPAYAVVLSGSVDKELHYCGACGDPVWISVPHDVWGRTWSAAGLPNP